MFKKATWKRGKQLCHGEWHYNWSADKFVIRLKNRTFEVFGNKPEWSGWKLQK
jgi:hypothetical protein